MKETNIFKTFYNNLRRPKLIFVNLKNKTSKVIIYILFLTLIMSIPAIITSFINPSNFLPSNNIINNSLEKVFDEGILIEENKLVITESKYLDLGVFGVVIGDDYFNGQGIFVQFEEEALVTFLNLGNGVKFETKRTSYEALEINSLTFKRTNKTIISTLIINAMATDNKVITFLLFSFILANLFELIFVILMLSLISNLITKVPIKFKDHFKINTNVATIFAFSVFILTIFGLGNLSLVAIILAYIYQVISYRAIAIISKVKVEPENE